MWTSFHHQPEAQHPNFQLPTSLQADYPIFGPKATAGDQNLIRRCLRPYQPFDPKNETFGRS